jgi:hypothetical protein
VKFKNPIKTENRENNLHDKKTTKSGLDFKKTIQKLDKVVF